jgi:hypothetical protein
LVCARTLLPTRMTPADTADRRYSEMAPIIKVPSGMVDGAVRRNLVARATQRGRPADRAHRPDVEHLMRVAHMALVMEKNGRSRTERDG